MSRHAPKVVLALLGAVLAIWAAEVTDLSGTWRLNREESRWGKKRPPQSLMVIIEHREPVLQYNGTVVEATGADSRQFQFAGSIDGKEYPETGGYGSGKRVLKRVDPSTIVSEFRSDDGSFVETARTRVSGNGKTIHRRVEVKGPEGLTVWTEVYDRQ